MNVRSPKSTRGCDADEVFTSVLATTLVLLVAVVEAGVFVPAIARLGLDAWSTHSSAASFSLMILAWILFLRSEYFHRYERQAAKRAREMAWTLQGLIVPVGTLATWRETPFSGPVLGLFVVVAMRVWKGYIDSIVLRPEEQKVLDEIIERQNAIQHERRKEKEDSRHAARLAAAVTRYRDRSLAEELRRGAGPPASSWEIPDGKHASRVYFIRNGNRIKIGVTTNLRRRVRSLALRPGHLALIEIGGRGEERAHHERFREGDTEWFRDAGELTQYIEMRTEEIRRERGEM
jgi:hypothetical protein